MPLWAGPSDRAFKHNVRTEYNALRKQGKSKAKANKQAVRIAYAIQRRAKRRGKRKK
jgi:hypothetical protein